MDWSACSSGLMQTVWSLLGLLLCLGSVTGQPVAGGSILWDDDPEDLSCCRLPSDSRHLSQNQPGHSMKTPCCGKMCVSLTHVSALLISFRLSTSPHRFSSKPWFVLSCVYYLKCRLVRKEPAGCLSHHRAIIKRKVDDVKDGSQLSVAAT